RYDRQEHVKLLNDLYELLRLYTNFFLPVQKLIKKERIGSKVKKTHDKA
ncbi:MAG: transposase, partial [Candidatus Levybacteria bacterium CG10_big_fil_rev_8_21_14_0_10_35_13]